MPKYPQDFRKYLHMPEVPPLRLGSLFTRKRLLIGSGIILAFLLVTPLATYALYARDINNRDRLMNHNNTGIELKDRNGQVFYSYGHMGGGNVPLKDISPDIQHALIASEDKDFYRNNGVSLRGMARALYGDVLNADPTRYGGSTITQQLVKNKLLTADKNILRKYQEISMAVAVDRRYSKNEILEMYLNSVYFGEGAFGVKDAAKTYFNTTPDKLTAAQSAMLVGLLPAPSAYSPISGSEKLAVREQHRVLDKMQQNGYLSAGEKQAAEASQLTYASGDTGQTSGHAQHFAAMVMDELKQKYGEERINRSGFEVTTTLDINAQQQAEEIVKKRVASFEANGGNNAALVAIDAKTGYLRALVGSVDWNNPKYGQVNMAITPRQPGSSFKPIYYSYALDKHLITAGTILHDSPTTFGDWTPHDVDNHFRGNVTVRQALAQSMNIPAAEVMQKVTPEVAAQTAHDMGISTITHPENYGLTLAVGTAEAKLEEMTHAYTTFANAGEQVPTVMVTNIQDKYGSTVFKYKEPKAKRLRSPEATYVLNSILDDNNARAPLYGSSLNIPGHQVAVKTGTTDENVDAWTIGYTPSLTIGVWVGNNEHKPMQGLAGGSSAGQIWRETMTKYIGDKPNEAFAQPSGVRQIAACGGGTEYYISGTEPTCTPPNHVAEQPKKNEDDNSDKPKDETPPAAGSGDGTTTNQTANTTTTTGASGTGGRGAGDSTGGSTTTTPPSGSGSGSTSPSSGSGGTTPPPSNGGSGSTPPPSGGGSTSPSPQPQSQPSPQ